MYHQPVLQRPVDAEEDRLSRDTKSPTQTSFSYSPGRSQHSKPPTPAPLSLQPSFSAARNPPGSPQTALPPISSAIYSRETPVSNYYDPTQDTGDRTVGRSGGRYETFPAEVRDLQLQLFTAFHKSIKPVCNWTNHQLATAAPRDIQ
jgi:DNA helicase INO80